MGQLVQLVKLLSATIKIVTPDKQKGNNSSIANKPFLLTQDLRGIELVVVQPTPFCNLDCDYCYLPGRNAKHRMPLSLVETLAHRLTESGMMSTELTVVWHAGEPLIMSIDYYKAAIEIFEQYLPEPIQVKHAFQTNATLIDAKWCRFFTDPRVSVGVSLDGPAPLHDAHRKTRLGNGTLATALKGVALLRQNAISFHVITVLTRDSLEFPDELFDFYMEQGISRIGFNIEELEGVNSQSSLMTGGIEADFKRFFRRFISLCHRFNWPLRVREFDQLTVLLSSRTHAAQNHQISPFDIINVDWQGNLSTYSPELLGVSTPRYPSFIIGNIIDSSFGEIIENPQLHALDDDINQGLAQCRQQCSYFEWCGGGAPANKVFENGSLASSETLYCRLMRKALLDIVLEKIDCFSNLSLDTRLVSCRTRSREQVQTVLINPTSENSRA